MLVTIEGISGAGKTTQVQMLNWEKIGIGGCQYILFGIRDPGTTFVGKKIRDILKGELSLETETLLFAAARAELNSRTIVPILEEGEMVLVCDRYIDSMRAYQGAGKGVEAGIIRELNHYCTRGRKPELTIILDGEPEQLLRRARQTEYRPGGANPERVLNSRAEEEELDLEFHQKVREEFLRIAEEEPKRVVVLDAIMEEQKLKMEIIKEIIQRGEQCLPYPH